MTQRARITTNTSNSASALHRPSIDRKTHTRVTEQNIHTPDRAEQVHSRNNEPSAMDLYASFPVEQRTYFEEYALLQVE